MKRLFLVDFDRTLFDTARFQNDLTLALTHGNPGEQKQFLSSIPKFTDPATGFYDFFAHATRHTTLSRDQILKRLDTGLPAAGYTFPDARDWVAQHRDRDQIVILSVGSPAYQNLKLQHAPALGHLPRHFIAKNKSLHLQEELDGPWQPPYSLTFVPGRFDEIFLIDDSPPHLEHLPSWPGISGIHLARTGGKYSHLPSPTRMKTIRNLGELT